MIANTSNEMIPDISRPNIFTMLAEKYVIKPNVVIINVSFTTETERNLKCLNIKQVKKPKNTPIAIETMPRDKNSARIRNGVEAVNDLD